MKQNFYIKITVRKNVGIQSIYQMLNSKEVRDIGRAFQMVINASTVKQGQQKLKYFRKSKIYPLLLANYISELKYSTTQQCKLLAVLELKKIQQYNPEHQCIWWHLNEQYYHGSDRISTYILDICERHHQSFKSLLNYPWENNGFAKAIRLVNMLKLAISKNQTQQIWIIIQTTLLKAITMSLDTPQLVQLFLVCLYAFNQRVGKGQAQTSIDWKEKLKQFSFQYILPMGELILSSLQKKTINPHIFLQAFRQSLNHNILLPQKLLILSSLYQNTINCLPLLIQYSILIQGQFERLTVKSDIFYNNLLQNNLQKLLQKILNQNQSIFKQNIPKDKQFAYQLLLFIGLIEKPYWAQLKKLNQYVLACLQSILDGQFVESNNFYLIGIVNYGYKNHQQFEIVYLLRLCEVVSKLALKFTGLSYFFYEFISALFAYIYDKGQNLIQFERFTILHLQNLNENGFGISQDSYQPYLIYFKQLSFVDQDDICKMFQNMISMINECGFDLESGNLLLEAFKNSLNDQRFKKQRLLNIMKYIKQIIIKNKIFSEDAIKIYSSYVLNNTQSQNKVMPLIYQNNQHLISQICFQIQVSNECFGLNVEKSYLQNRLKDIQRLINSLNIQYQQQIMKKDCYKKLGLQIQQQLINKKMVIE